MVLQVQGRNRPVLSLRGVQAAQPFDEVATILAQRPPYSTPPIAPPRAGVDTPDEPFTWGPNGERRTQADIDIIRALSKDHLAAGMDFSPVQHWSQGLARVAQGLVGGLEAREADKAAQANAAYSQEAMANLTPTAGQPTLEAAMRAAADPYASPEVRQMGQFWMERLVPKPSTAQPYRQEDNAGNVWQQDPTTGEFKLIFTDRAPRQMVANGQLITSTNPYVDGAIAAIPATGPQPGAVVDDPRLAATGGAGPQAPRPFPQ